MRRLHADKFLYYSAHTLRQLIPAILLQRRLTGELRCASELEERQVRDRVDYYLALEQPFALPETAKNYRQMSWEGFWLRRGVARLALRHFGLNWNKAYNSSYYMDFKRVIRSFPKSLRYAYQFGDNRHNPAAPSFVKSRPIGALPNHGVLLNLDGLRHFQRVQDQLPFVDKKPLAVFRGACHQPRRQAFLATACGLPNTDIGDTRPKAQAAHRRPFMSKQGQLDHRYIISLEGNDVATNLKWILSSNSLCLMPKPTVESWFMEGRLQAGVHYVEIRPDGSDLPEVMDFYNRNPQAALPILEAGKRHWDQFLDPGLERRIALRVAEKYFRLSGQLPL